MEDKTQQQIYFSDLTAGDSMPLLRSIDKSVRELRDILYEFRRDVKSEVKILHEEINNIDSHLEKQEQKIDTMTGQLIEAQKNIAVLSSEIEHVDKRIDDTKTSQDKWFQLVGFLVVAVPIAVAIINAFIKN